MITKEDLTRLEDINYLSGIKENYEFINKEENFKIDIRGNSTLGYQVFKLIANPIPGISNFHPLFKKGFHYDLREAITFEDLDSALRALNKELGYTI